VTERKREELERRRVAEKSRKELELRAHADRMAHLGLWVWDIRQNRVTWSDELFRIYGLDSSSFGASFEAYLACLHPQDRQRVRDTIERGLRDRKPLSFDERIVRPDGDVRWLHSWSNVSTGGDGQLTEMFGACIDVTEMVRTTEELRRKEAWLQATLESARVALWEWEIQENCVHWSEGAEKALGFPPGALGQSFDAYLVWVHAEDHERVLEALRVSVDTSVDISSEHRLVFPEEGTRWVVVRGT
jgi:PAS domain S-box-containing protein